MAVNPNFTNANATTPFAQGIFDNGIQIGPTIELGEGSIGTLPVGYVSDVNTGDNSAWLASQLIAGDISMSYLKLTSSTVAYVDGNNENEIRALTLGNSAFALTNISSINGVAPGASSASYISSINLPLLLPSGLNATAKGFASTVMAGMPTGSTIQAQMDIDVTAPGGSNVIGTLWAGMGTQTGGVSFFTPVYFNTANPASATVVSMNGLINIPKANDGIVIALSNGSTGGLLPVQALGLKLSLVSI